MNCVLKYQSEIDWKYLNFIAVCKVRLCGQQFPGAHISIDGGEANPAGRQQNR